MQSLSSKHVLTRLSILFSFVFPFVHDFVRFSFVCCFFLFSFFFLLAVDPTARDKGRLLRPGRADEVLRLHLDGVPPRRASRYRCSGEPSGMIIITVVCFFSFFFLSIPLRKKRNHAEFSDLHDARRCLNPSRWLPERLYQVYLCPTHLSFVCYLNSPKSVSGPTR